MLCVYRVESYFNMNSVAQKLRKGIPPSTKQTNNQKKHTLRIWMCGIIRNITHIYSSNHISYVLKIYIYSHYPNNGYMCLPLANYLIFFFLFRSLNVCGLFFSRCLRPADSHFFLHCFFFVLAVALLSFYHFRINFLVGVFIIIIIIFFLPTLFGCVLRFFCFRRQIK